MDQVLQQVLPEAAVAAVLPAGAVYLPGEEPVQPGLLACFGAFR
jgi:hypothetical protein